MNLISPRPEIRRTVTPRGVVLEREHWDGHQDAKATPAPLRLKAKPSQADYLRLIEFEYAGAELRSARHSADPSRINRATYRFNKAREAMTTQVRFGPRTRELIHESK